VREEDIIRKSPVGENARTDRLLARGTNAGAVVLPAFVGTPAKSSILTFGEFEDTPETQIELAALLDSVSKSGAFA
jgi:hypothetical protein